jgi:hypothetical protein
MQLLFAYQLKCRSLIGISVLVLETIASAAAMPWGGEGASRSSGSCETSAYWVKFGSVVLFLGLIVDF